MRSRPGAIPFKDAYPVFEKQLLEVQNPLKVDTVAGAILATYRYQIVVLNAIHEYKNRQIINKVYYNWENGKTRVGTQK